MVPQWWSKIYTQFPQAPQWLARLGLIIWQVLQYLFFYYSSSGITKYFLYFSGYNYKIGLLGMIPGLLQAVNTNDISANEAHNKNDKGKAGLTSQFISNMKMHKGTTNAAKHTWMYIIPGNYFGGPETQHPK